MIIGNGQLAQTFKNTQSDMDNVVIFASGVSNSKCIDGKEFYREKKLLIKTLEENQAKKFVYFSSSAISAKDYPKNAYYQHKKKMEDIIKKKSCNYYIFRVPQLFGELKTHKTIINFLYESVRDEKEFKVYDNAYRYVIEINDLYKIVKNFIEFSDANIIVDIANPYRYNVLNIVNIFETLLSKKARYKIIAKDDQYLLNLNLLEDFIKEHQLDMNFGKDYLVEKLKRYI